MNAHELTLKQLDKGLESWKTANIVAPRPKAGWVRTIRKALGMKISQLASRLEVNKSRVIKIEMAETLDAVTLGTLREVASALECELVYAFVPKISLKNILMDRSKKIAKKRIQRVSQSMALENQSVSKSFEEELLDEYKLPIYKTRYLNALWNEFGEKK